MWNLCEGMVWFFGNPFELLSSVFDLRSCCGVFFCGIYVGERMIFVKPFRAGVVWVWFEILLWVVHFLWNLCGGTIWSFWDPFDFGCAFNFCGIYYQWRYVFCCTISISCPLHLIWEFFANIFPPVHSICVQICRGGKLGLQILGSWKGGLGSDLRVTKRLCSSSNRKYIKHAILDETLSSDFRHSYHFGFKVWFLSKLLGVVAISWVEGVIFVLPVWSTIVCVWCELVVCVFQSVW